MGGTAFARNRQASREEPESQLGNITGAVRLCLVGQLVEQAAGGRRLGLDFSQRVTEPRSHVAQKRGGSPLVARG